MTNCKFCKKVTNFREGDIITFCDKDCLDQYCDEYIRDNWRDYCNMLGVRVID